jgi:prepilin-type N-terminal cleavage/methylation domain-containing protein
MSSLRRTRGFTLVEVLVTTGIAAVLAAVAVPSFSQMLKRQQLSGAVQELSLALELARNEASTSGVRAVVAARDGTDWASGWRVFRDADDNGRLDPGEVVLREFVPPAEGIRFTPRFGAGVPTALLSFDDTGFVRRPGSNGLVMGRITLTQDGQIRTFCFGATRVRVVRVATCG